MTTDIKMLPVVVVVVVVVGSLVSASPASNNPNDDTNTDHSKECVVCYEAFQVRSGWRLECGHKFHKSCLTEWARLQRQLGLSCPMCRRDIRLENGENFQQFVEQNLAAFKQNIRATWGLLGSFEQPVYWGAPV